MNGFFIASFFVEHTLRKVGKLFALLNSKLGINNLILKRVDLNIFIYSFMRAMRELAKRMFY